MLTIQLTGVGLKLSIVAANLILTESDAPVGNMDCLAQQDVVSATVLATAMVV